MSSYLCRGSCARSKLHVKIGLSKETCGSDILQCMLQIFCGSAGSSPVGKFSTEKNVQKRMVVSEVEKLTCSISS